jgi:hypothetical protein
MAPDRRYAFSADLSDPTVITYVNGIVARTPRAWAWMMVRLPPTLFLVRAQEGCLQAKSFLGGPREMLMLSYWRDEASLRGLYTHPVHVRLMRTVFRHPDWFTLFNETYRGPISTRYWHEPNGFALGQRWQAATIDELHDANLLPAEVVDVVAARADR